MIKAAARAYYQNLVDTLAPPNPIALAAKDPTAVLRSNVLTSSGELVQILDGAQSFSLDHETTELLTELLAEMGDGVLEMFRETPLPFPTLWVERKQPVSGQTQAALIIQDGDRKSVV